MDLKLEKYVINKYANMTRLFDRLGIDYRVDGNMLCPFHGNDNTPASHLYHNKDGYCLWCFAEGRMYGSWNVYKEFFPKINTTTLAEMILAKLDNSTKEEIQERLNIENEEEHLPYLNTLLKFRKSEITINELMNTIANSFTD